MSGFARKRALTVLSPSLFSSRSTSKATITAGTGSARPNHVDRIATFSIDAAPGPPPSSLMRDRPNEKYPPSPATERSRPPTRQQLDQMHALPVGSWKASEWKQASEGLKPLTHGALNRGESLFTVRSTFALLERFLRELHTDTVSQHAGQWIREPVIVNRIVSNWAMLANTRECCRIVYSPTEFAARLEQLSVGLEKVYDIVTIHRILHVAIQQGPPNNAPIVAESLLQFALNEAKKGNNPALQPTAVTWTQVVKAWAKSGLPEAPQKINALFERLKQLGLQPTLGMYSELAHSWWKHPDDDLVVISHIQAALEQAQADGLEPDVVFWNKLIQDCAFRKFPHAIDTMHGYLQQMKNQGIHPTASTWEHFVWYWGLQGTAETPARLLEIFEQMRQQGVEPTISSYEFLISSWTHVGQPTKAEDVLRHVISKFRAGKHHFKPSLLSINGIITAYSRHKDPRAPERAFQLLQCVEEANIPGAEPDCIMYSTLMDCFARSGDAKRAASIMKYMHELSSQGRRDAEPNSVTYSILIKAFCFAGKPECAEDLLRDMLGNSRTQPSTRSFWTALDAWTRSSDPNAPERASKLLRFMETSEECKSFGIRPNTICYNSYLMCIAISGRPDAGAKAEDVLNGMERRHQIDKADIKPCRVSYTIVIKACLRSNDPDRAERLLQRMYDSGVPPNTRTFTELLLAYSRLRTRDGADRAEKLLWFMRERSLTDPDFEAPPDEWSTNTVLGAWARVGDAEALQRVVSLYDRLVAGELGIQPNYISHGTVIRFFSLSGSLEVVHRADSILRECAQAMGKDDVATFKEESRYVYLRIMKAWLRHADIERADSILSLWEAEGSKGSMNEVPMWSAFRLMADARMKVEDESRARRVFERGQQLHKTNIASFDDVLHRWREHTGRENTRYLHELTIDSRSYQRVVRK